MMGMMPDKHSPRGLRAPETERKMARIDVLMPVYNAARTIDPAIESILAQTHGDWRMWVVDDASSDDTAGKVGEWAQRDARITLLRGRQNLGPGGALNHAAMASGSRYLAIMHADDVSREDRLALQVEHLESRRDIHVVGGAALYVDEADQERGIVMPPLEHEDIVARIPWATPFIHSTVAMRRTFLQEMGGYAHRRTTEDADLWIRGATQYRYCNLPEVLLTYRMRSRMTRHHIGEGIGVRYSSRHYAQSSRTALMSALRFGAASMMYQLGWQGKWQHQAAAESKSRQ